MRLAGRLSARDEADAVVQYLAGTTAPLLTILRRLVPKYLYRQFRAATKLFRRDLADITSQVLGRVDHALACYRYHSELKAFVLGGALPPPALFTTAFYSHAIKPALRKHLQSSYGLTEGATRALPIVCRVHDGFYKEWGRRPTHREVFTAAQTHLSKKITPDNLSDAVRFLLDWRGLSAAEQKERLLAVGASSRGLARSAEDALLRTEERTLAAMRLGAALGEANKIHPEYSLLLLLTHGAEPFQLYPAGPHTDGCPCGGSVCDIDWSTVHLWLSGRSGLGVDIPSEWHSAYHKLPGIPNWSGVEEKLRGQTVPSLKGLFIEGERKVRLSRYLREACGVHAVGTRYVVLYLLRGPWPWQPADFSEIVRWLDDAASPPAAAWGCICRSLLLGTDQIPLAWDEARALLRPTKVRLTGEWLRRRFAAWQNSVLSEIGGLPPPLHRT